MATKEAAEWLDGEYPTDAALDRIEHWDCIEEPDGGLFKRRGLMAFVQSIWWAAPWGWHQEGDDYYISTGGWSGNESIIAALKGNFIFWSLHHRSTRAGGHFMFCFHAMTDHDLCGACKGTGMSPLDRKATG